MVKAPPPAPLEIVFKVHLGCDRGRSGKQKRCSRNARRRREGRAVQGQEEEEEEEEVHGDLFVAVGFRLTFARIMVCPPQVHAKFANGYFGYKR